MLITKLLSLICLIIATGISCTSDYPLLRQGSYNVTCLMIVDECGWQDVEMTHTVWKIDHIQGQYYGVAIEGGTAKASGGVDAGQIIMHRDQHEYLDTCHYYKMDVITIDPDIDSDYFTGTLTIDVDAECMTDDEEACTCPAKGQCHTEWITEGYLQKE